MRRTLPSLMPTASAMVRVVMVATRLVRRVPIVRVRHGRGASFCNPARPSARKRLRRRETFFGVMAMTDAISLSGWPEAANNTMRARSTTRTGRDRLRAWDSKTVRSSGLNLMAGLCVSATVSSIIRRVRIDKGC